MVGFGMPKATLCKGELLNSLTRLKGCRWESQPLRLGGLEEVWFRKLEVRKFYILQHWEEWEAPLSFHSQSRLGNEDKWLVFKSLVCCVLGVIFAFLE